MAKAKCRWDCPHEWSDWNAYLSSGLHGRNRWRLGVLLTGMLFAGGRRTVTSWLRAAGVSDDYQDYYYFLECVGQERSHAVGEAPHSTLRLSRKRQAK